MKVILAVLAIIAFALCADYSITLKEQVDFAKIRDPISLQSLEDLDFISKGRLVVNELKHVAEITQRPIREYLESKSIKYTSYWITNSIFVHDPDAETLEELAKRDDVAGIRVLEDLRIQLEKPYGAESFKQGVEWNVEMVKAPKAWAKGFEGQGVVLGVLDTGVNVEHPDLVTKYRGYKGNGEFDHDYNWKDGVVRGTCTDKPCDQHGHGSHVTGTILGSNDRETVGVAPKAQHMQCRSFATGGAGIQDILNCFQWFLAPTRVDGTDENPDKRPHAINHSWGSTRPVTEFNRAIDALHAAGSLQIFAAGNSGPRCSSLGYPGAIEPVLTVGALATRSRNIASFSSRGPAPGSYTKPNVVAPGQNIRSCSHRGSGYATMSGTSMATPAVTGSVGLLYSAKPELIGKIKETISHIQSNADPILDKSCSSKSDNPNNVYGYGLIDNDKNTN